MIALLFLSIYTGFSLWLLTGIWRLKAQPISADKGFFSIIIAAHNEEATIATLLEALVAQQYPQDNFEVILAADRCSDQTVPIAASFENKFTNFKIIQISETPESISPKKHALESAIAAAGFDRLLFLDADVCPTPQHLATIDRYFANDTAVVIGLMRYPESNNMGGVFLIFEKMISWGIAAASVGHRKPIISYGGNWAYRRDAFQQADGFGDTLQSLSGDDDLLLQKFAELGLGSAICLHPGGWVTTDPPLSFAHFLRQRRRHFSAGKRYRPLVQAGYFVFHLINLLLWTGPFFLSGGIAVLLMKLGIDVLLATYLGKRFDIRLSAAKIPFYSFIFMLYNTLIGPLGHLGKIRW